MSSRISRSLAKALGIKLQDPNPWEHDVTRGGGASSSGAGPFFVEEHPRVSEVFMGLRPSRQQVLEYLLSLFPFVSWISHYNLKWFLGDLVAGRNHHSTLIWIRRY